MKTYLAKEDTLPVCRIGFVRKYFEGSDNYISLIEAIRYSCWENKVRMEIVDINTEDETGDKINEEFFKTLDCVIVPGGFGTRGVENKVKASRLARKLKLPYLGICLGF